VSERAPLPEVPARLAAGPVLVFAPHADDDVIGCGGCAALHVEQGDPVRVVVVYDGLAGDPDRRHEPEAYRARRQREAVAGGAHLGLADYAFWDYPEGHEPDRETFSAAAVRVAALVRETRPRSVYAPWVGEHHLDHHVLARVVRAGLALAGFDGEAWGYEVWTPLVATRVVDVSRVLARKQAALAEHRSQLEATEHPLRILGINAHRSIYLPAGATAGEALRPLGAPGARDAAWVGLAGGGA